MQGDARGVVDTLHQDVRQPAAVADGQAVVQSRDYMVWVAHPVYRVLQAWEVSARSKDEVLELVRSVTVAIVANEHDIVADGQPLGKEDRSVGCFVQHEDVVETE